MHQDAILKQNNKRFVIRQLTQRDITPTQQRVEIGLVLLTKRQHLSAEQVLDRVNTTASIVSKATVYNTLSLFVRKGLVKEVNIDSTRILYDSNTRHHHHFYNVDTGILYDIDAEQLELKQVPTPPEFAAIKDVEIIVRVQQAQTST